MPWFWKGRKKNSAKSIVSHWERSQTSQIANDVVRIIPDKVPFLRQVASGALEGIIKKNIAFSAAEPEELSGNLYQVTDTVTVKIASNIPLIGKQFSLYIDYRIKVDVKAKKVLEATPDLSSFRINFV